MEGTSTFEELDEYLSRNQFQNGIV